jgi:endo-1,4-beta-xylanase
MKLPSIITSRTRLLFLSTMIAVPLISATVISNNEDQAALETTKYVVADPEKGLKDYYKKYFSMGVAVNMRAIRGTDAQLVVKEFNSVTAENDMKMGPIHPKENEYNWANADSIVAFAQRNNIKVRGHNLLWHSQAPAWMFKDSLGNTVTKEVLLKRLKEHITTVVKRYKGKIYAWDVVNEAIDDNPDVYMRNTLWYQICGDDFIPAAFRYAHEADPNVALYYNDYNSENPAKRDKIYKLVKSLIDAKVPIDGIGLQGHWKLADPTPELIRAALDKYASLGVKLQITELDVTIREPQPRRAPGDTSPVVMPYDSGYTASIEKRQVARYESIFKIFREYKKVITNVTFWNLSDRQSWLDSRGGGLAGGAAASSTAPPVIRKAYPLLFDVNLQRKKAYQAVVDF